MMDQLLGSLGIKYEDLDTPGKYSGEVETLTRWLTDLSEKRVTMESLKGYIIDMRASVQKDLAKAELNTHQDLYLKARMMNYILLEAFLTGPDKAKEELDKLIAQKFSKVKIS